MIIGRTLEATFPPKHVPTARRGAPAADRGAERRRLREHLVQRPPGEIVGVAGVIGNGQPALLRALAGREAATGSITVGGKELSRRALLESSAYMPADRLTEGLMTEPQRARERRADRARLAQVGALHQPAPRDRGRGARALRAGRQGAVARGSRLGALGRQPAEGRDGARACSPSRPSWSPTSRRRASTSARAPRSTASSARSAPAACPSSLASSDALELEGLCDRVIVMSRGQVVATLEGDDGDRGEDHPRGDQRDDAHRRADGAARRAAGRGRRASSRATTPPSSSSRR